MSDVYTVINPATAAPVVDVPLASLAEADAAIERAHAAFPAWKAIPPGERATLLRRFAAVVDAHVDELAELEVRNAGHTWGNARWEAGNVRDCLNYYAGAPERLFGRQIPVAGGIDVTIHEPLGVVGIIVPVELPDAHRRLGFRARAGRRQHRRAQAGRAHAADRDPARRAGPGGRPARRRAHRHPRQGVGRR